jgi:hypothetical protein
VVQIDFSSSKIAQALQKQDKNKFSRSSKYAIDFS